MATAKPSAPLPPLGLGAGTLPGWWLKFRRGEQHLEVLRGYEKQWRAHAQASARLSVSPTEYKVVLPPVPIARDEVSLLVGEVVQSWRTALDHLAFAMARPQTVAEIRSSEFPICFDAQAFQRARGKISRWPIEARERLSRLQPFESPDASQHPLWLLQQLNVVDKHRQLHVATPLSGGLQIDADLARALAELARQGGGGLSIQLPSQQVDTRQLVLRITWEQPLANPPRLDLLPALLFHVNPGGPEPSRHPSRGIVGQLNAIGMYITDTVFADLESFVDRSADELGLPQVGNSRTARRIAASVVAVEGEMVSRVTWAEGKLALDLHIGEVVRVVVMGMFGNIHAEGVLQPADEAGPSDDHAFYKLVTEGSSR